MKKLFVMIAVFAIAVSAEAQVKVNNGNVGIGLGNNVIPSQKLEVNGHILLSGKDKSLYFGDSPSCLKWGIEYLNTSDQGLNFWIPWNANCGTNFGNYMLFLKDNGNIGINTNNPSQKLHVDGGLRVGSDAFWNQTVRDINMIRIGDGDYIRIGEWEADDRLSFKANSYSFTNGNVGIGRVPHSTAKLDVGGSIAVMGTVVIGSDERMKTEIRPISNEKEKLYLLQGKSYRKTFLPTNVNNSTSDQKETISEEKEKLSERKEITEFPEYGYLAQELKDIFPDLVSQDAEGYYAVNYIGLIPIIVEALKDQKLTIENLQQERESQQNINKDLLQKLESLEKALATCCSKDNTKSIEKSFQQFDLTDPADAIETMKVYQNAPNPFNERTTIQCYIPQTVKKAELCVYNMQGAQVKCLLVTERGTVDVQIQAGQLAAGVYTYLLIGDGKTSDAKQMILTK